MSASSGYGSGGSGPVGPGILTLEGNSGGPVGPNGVGNLFVPGTGPIVTTGNPGTNTITVSLDGTVATQYDEDTGSAIPVGGILNVIGGPSTAGGNIVTAGTGNTVQVILNDSLLFPNTNALGTEGVLFWGGDTFIHNFGLNNTYVGSNAGNLTGIGINNVGIGTNVLNAQTAASNLVAIGANALLNASTGVDCIAIGSLSMNLGTALESSVAIGIQSLSQCLTGEYNIAIGEQAGINYTNAESSNILINNLGLAGENNVIRLGIDGFGVGSQDATYIAGIYNRAFSSPSGVVQIDSNFKLGSSAGTDGQLLIGSTGASPLWANLTSVGGTVVITNAPNAINLEATGTGAGASEFPVDMDGPADEIGGILNLFGGPGILSGINNIHTQAVALSNTVRFILNDSLYFPLTQADGSGGVLYWNSVPAVQFFGTGNTFIGAGAGNLSLTTGDAIDNTAIGESCLPSLTTSPENTFVGSASGSLLSTGLGLNCGYGFGALDNLVSGDNNVAIGVLAGTNYTTNETNNILISSFGSVGESNTTRIGRTQTDAYMAGVYGASIGTINAPVFIDNNGKLGTLEAGVNLNGSSFMGVVTGTEVLSLLAPVIGTFFVGAQQPMTVLYDNFAGAFDPGDGVGGPATFTAPIDGFWSFSAAFILQPTSSGQQLDAIINVNGSPFIQNKMPNFNGSGTQTTMATSVTCYVQLAANDTVTFSAIINASILNPPRGFAGGPTPYQTYVSGQLLRTS